MKPSCNDARERERMKDQFAWWKHWKRRRRKKVHLLAKKVLQERQKDREGESRESVALTETEKMFV